MNNADAAKIADQAHHFAQFTADRFGIPANKFAAANKAAETLRLAGKSKELFFERAVGHWMNMAAGTDGM